MKPARTQSADAELDAAEDQVERVARLAAAVERVCTEVLVRIEFLEQDVKRLMARERES